MHLDRVVLMLARPRAVYDIPRAAVHVITEVHFVLTLVPAQLHLIAIERPRPEFHFTLLLIEGEVLHVDGAGALIDGGRDPEHLTRVIYDHVRLIRHFVFAISTAT